MDSCQPTQDSKPSEIRKLNETQIEVSHLPKRATKSSELVDEVIDTSFSKVSPYVFVPKIKAQNTSTLNQEEKDDTPRRKSLTTKKRSSTTKKRSSATTKQVLKILKEAAAAKLSNSTRRKIKKYSS